MKYTKRQHCILVIYGAMIESKLVMFLGYLNPRPNIEMQFESNTLLEVNVNEKQP